MSKRARWIMIICSTAVLLLIFTVSARIASRAWQAGRDHALLAFCKGARPGMSFGDLVALERRHRINESYLGQARFKGYVDQAHSNDLEFRSQWFDPDFACMITHDGLTVTSVRLLTLDGVKLE